MKILALDLGLALEITRDFGLKIFYHRFFKEAHELYVKQVFEKYIQCKCLLPSNKTWRSTHDVMNSDDVIIWITCQENEKWMNLIFL